VPTTYTLADIDATNLLARVMAAHYPRLHDAGVRVGILFARNADGPALKRGGYEVLAYVRPVPLRDRLTKGYDAELVIDGGEWERLRPRQQESLCHHELGHLDTIDLTPAEMKAREGDESVAWRTDGLGRPKLKRVPGDWIGGDGFDETVAVYGADAIEYEAIARCKAKADAARNAADRAGGPAGPFDDGDDDTGAEVA
jgi:hypothetical protein